MVWCDGSTHQTTIVGVKSVIQKVGGTISSTAFPQYVLLRIWKNAGKNHGARHTITLLRMIAVFMSGLNSKFTDATWFQGKGYCKTKNANGIL